MINKYFFLPLITTAFFSSYTQAVLPDMDDLKAPKITTVPCENISINGSGGYTVCSDNDPKFESCSLFAQDLPAESNNSYDWYAGGSCYYEGSSLRIRQEGVRRYSDGEIVPTSYTWATRAKNIRGVEKESCPPPTYPEHTIVVPVDGSTMCGKPFDPYDNCPAAGDSDMPVFGTGLQVTQCYANPDGSQCKIQSNASGDYTLPAAFGSSEPVPCQDAPYEPVPVTDDPTPPEPTEEADNTPQMNEIDALNLINENLYVMNNNQVIASTTNTTILQRVVSELQINNQVLGQIRNQPSNYSGYPFAPTDTGTDTGGDTGTEPCTGDDCIEEPTQEYNDECIGDLCEYDIEQAMSDDFQKASDWLEEDITTPTQVDTLTSKVTSFVSSNFSGFRGSCSPFTLNVSIKGDSKSIVVDQHCEPYETYFKPLVQWLLWVLTAIALINISSQSFRAFSTL
ncbi:MULTISPECIES: hypothetical protein [unclassified Pseudoalteromonas]|uniref:hypothetical protein n=1 Tax=unclassified Pseudoalteromonas TaxID=194690 RepID=UPI00235A1BF6|nr:MULTISPECIES: hypothetical protein [unclassified Pseudoalteromonas]MDC9564008.1 hypothetical protein [Pseudoalteromonas sp. GAB2316C]MDC9567950.1 hypothetical protein [Pseudoalteromonas sp. GABNB9D]MDC9572212.1 hypothetical protein [Pseudoalteromonas sp. GABNS16A]MDC9577347.1 hypothetical protein [Pseudoalteromonas sp. GABNS16E]MDC9586841.1 hypothetical protein [Pseudoalteromonas sp. GABNS16C]